MKNWKKPILGNKAIFTMALMICANFAAAQDVIYLTNGTNLMVEVISADDVTIEFKLLKEIDGAAYTVHTYEVRRILYDDGRLVEYGNPLVPNALPAISAREEAAITGVLPKVGNPEYMKGRRDAQLYYRKYRAAGTGVLITSLVSPVVGLVPALVTSSQQPNYRNMNFPSHERWNDADYRTGYIAGAIERKKKAVWNNYLIGLGVNVVAALVLISANQ